MKCVFLVSLLLLMQAAYAAKNITLSIDVPQENPADVSYVEGKAPEELKAGPSKNTTSPIKETIAQAAFIRSSNREIPKDDEIENEEFERFIKKYHSGPTIETVFVSTSPSPPAEDSEELNEETITKEPQVEVFKKTAQLRTFERSVAHPTLTSHILPPPEHQLPTYSIVNHQPHDASLHHGGSASFSGSDGYIFQSDGGAAGNEGFILQSGGGNGGQFVLTGAHGNGGGQFVLTDGHGNGGGQFELTNSNANGGGQFVLTDSQGGGGEQQYYQFANFVPRTFNVAQNAVKTKTYEIRRPAIQKHYYDIEERVIVRPAGSVIVELDRPVAKVPTGETVIAVGGLTGSLIGNGFQQSSQGGISFSNAFGFNGGGGVQQGGFDGSGITYTSSVGAPSTSGSIGGFQQSQGSIGGAQGVIGIQQSQGAIGGAQGGIGFQQSQGGVTISTTTPSPNGSPTSTVVIGTQQQQGAIGASGAGFQQSQTGISVTTTPAPSVTQTSSTSGTLFGGTNGGFAGVGVQQSQGGISGAGFQQSQGGVTFSTTTPAPGNSPTSSTTNIFVGSSNGGLSGSGFQQTQGGISSFERGLSAGGYQQSQRGGAVYSSTGVPFFQSTTPLPSGGGFSGVGFQQSQGGYSGSGFQQSQGVDYSTTPAPYLPPAAPTSTVLGIKSNGGFAGSGFQQSQGGIGLAQGGSSYGGFQQSQGGGGYSTTGLPFFASSTSPLPSGGGYSGAGFQQSQGGFGISQGGGFSGSGLQQSQGSFYSSTPAPYLPPAAPTPTVLTGKSNGGFSGVSFQQSQGGVSQGDITASSSIGLAKGGSFGGGEIIYSTTASSPSYSLSGSRSILLRPQSGGGYPSVSTTTGGPIIITALNQHGNNGNSFVIQSNSNVQSKGSVSSTTTTERSFSVSQGAVNKHINPNFSYPPYVEITSNGSPLGHLRQQPYTHQASVQNYPRMRYQGKLLTGEVSIDDGLAEQHESQQQGYGALSSHHQNYESPAYTAEILPNSPEEGHSSATVHKLELSNNQQSDESNPQHQHQYVGSSKQPIQDSQISSGANKQPDQIYQHHFLRTTSQPLVIPTNSAELHAPQNHAAQHQSAQQQYSQQNNVHPISSHQHSAQQQVLHHQAYPQQYTVQEQQPIQRANYQSRSRHYNDLQIIPTPTIHHQQHAAHTSNQQPIHHNLVAQTRHQQLAPKQQSHVQASDQQTEHHQPTESTRSKQQQVTESLEESLEVSEVHSSTHQQPTLFQKQVLPTEHSLEPYNSGQRQYKQRGAPSKYTQDQSLNVVPSEHTVYFNNNLEHTTARSQNIEIPSVQESRTEETSSGKYVESSAKPIVTITTSRGIEETTQRQTYASVLAQGKPGILYAPSRHPASHHSPGHKQHFLRFSADGSSLFSPSGRQVHLVYSQSPRAIYPHQTQTHSVPASAIEPAKQHIAMPNKGYQIQAQLPITRQSQIEVSASNKPALASEPQITRSQSHAASHQTSARYESISSTTPETATTTTKEHHKQRGPQKYRNEQTHGALTLRSGRTYGDHRVIASTPAPSDGGAASESVQTRRIVVNHPFQTIQEVVEREPFTNIHQVTVNAPAKQVLQRDGLQEGQQKSAAYRTPVPYKVAAQLNHPQATLSFHHGGGSH